jgi:N-acetylglucosaminyl-diphospho-decaprenol L-rhamnosyltransferase
MAKMTVKNLADVSVVIVSWNTRELLKKCLKSLVDTSRELRLQVIVVDNASTDGSTAMVEQEFPQVRLFKNSTNAGFARANNQAIAHCSADLVLLLNSDAVLINDGLAELVRFIKHHADAGAVGPKLVHPRARLRILGCGRQPTLWTVFTHFLGISYLIRNVRFFEGIHLWTGAHDRLPRKVEWLSGACLLVRRATINNVGALSEKWFMYAEDWEWCNRISRAGWKLYHVPSAVVEHYLSASAEQTEETAAMPLAAMRSYFVELNKPSKFSLLLFDIFRSVGFGLRGILYALRALTNDEDAKRIWLSRSHAFLNSCKEATPWRQVDMASNRASLST